MRISRIACFVLYIVFVSFTHSLWIPRALRNTSIAVDHGLITCDSALGDNLNKEDCHRAIVKLPYDQGVDPRRPEHVFSLTMANPRYRLPASTYAGNCIVDVGLIPGMRHDVSSWSRLKQETWDLFDACYLNGHGVAGYRSSGDRLSIKVTLYEKNAVYGEASVNNSTSSAGIDPVSNLTYGTSSLAGPETS